MDQQNTISASELVNESSLYPPLSLKNDELFNDFQSAEEFFSPMEVDPLMPVQPRSRHISHRSLLPDGASMLDDNYYGFGDERRVPMDVGFDSLNSYSNRLQPGLNWNGFSPSTPSNPYPSEFGDSLRYNPTRPFNDPYNPRMQPDFSYLSSEPPLLPDTDFPFIRSPPPPPSPAYFPERQPTHLRFNSSPSFPGVSHPAPSYKRPSTSSTAAAGAAGSGGFSLHARHASETLHRHVSPLPVSPAPRDTHAHPSLASLSALPNPKPDHHHEELPSKEASPTPKKLPYACRDFRSGKCTRGDACKFMHVLDSPESGGPHGNARDAATGKQKNVQICRDFLRGICQRKNCKFLHTLPENGSSAAKASYSQPYHSPVYPPQEAHSPVYYGNGGGAFPPYFDEMVEYTEEAPMMMPNYSVPYYAVGGANSPFYADRSNPAEFAESGSFSKRSTVNSLQTTTSSIDSDQVSST